MLRAIFKRLLQVMLHFPRFCIFAVHEGWRISTLLSNNSPRSIYTFQNSDVTPRLSGHFTVFGLVFFELKSFLRIVRQWSRKKFAILTLKPRSHVKILMYWAWAIRKKINPNHLLAGVCSHEKVGRRVQFRRCCPNQRFILWPTSYIRANRERHRK